MATVRFTHMRYILNLTNLFESLYGSPNVYFDMFNVFSERQKLLERHKMPFLKITFPEFKHHFEHHVPTLPEKKL